MSAPARSLAGGRGLRGLLGLLLRPAWLLLRGALLADLLHLVVAADDLGVDAQVAWPPCRSILSVSILSQTLGSCLAAAIEATAPPAVDAAHAHRALGLRQQADELGLQLLALAARAAAAAGCRPRSSRRR
jgi:hypothetical protein